MRPLGRKILEQVKRMNGSAKPVVEQLLKESIYMGENGRANCSSCDGGPHMHRLTALADNKWLVASGGSEHTHEVHTPDGRVSYTEADGHHTHTAVTDDQESAPENGHTHQLIVNGVLIESGPGSPHSHELLSNGTAIDGSHKHVFTIDGKKVTTRIPSDERKRRQADMALMNGRK